MVIEGLEHKCEDCEAENKNNRHYCGYCERHTASSLGNEGLVCGRCGRIKIKIIYDELGKPIRWILMKPIKVRVMFNRPSWDIIEKGKIVYSSYVMYEILNQLMYKYKYSRLQAEREVENARKEWSKMWEKRGDTDG